MSWHIRGMLTGLSRNTLLLAGASLFADLATEMLTPILPVFLTQTLKANGSIVGLVDGIAQALRNIVDGFFGPVSDRLQSRKPIALLGYVLAAIGKPVMGVSTGWQGVLVGRLLDRSGAGTFAAPRDALVSFSTDERHRGRGFGLENLGQNAGACLGPVLTVVLLYELQIDIRNLFYLAAVPALVAFAVVLMVREPARQSRPRGSVILYPTRLPFIYWKFLLTIAVFSIGNSSNSFLILRTQELSASLLTTTLIYSGFNLVAAIMSFPLGWLSDRWEKRRLILGIFGVSLLVYGGFAYTQSLAFVVLFFLAYGVYEAGFRSVGRAIASEFVSDELRASAMAWFSATAGLFQLVASLVGGLLWDQLGHSSTFIYGAISSATGILVGGLIFNQRRVAQASNQIR